MWAIQSTIIDYTFNTAGECRQIPTFHLNENVQGILTENQARHIAVKILNPFSNPNLIVFAGAVNVGSMCDEPHLPKSPDKYMFLVTFRSPYWKYWVGSEVTTVKALRWSKSGASLWCWINGQEKCVPKDILLKRCFYCEEWIRLSYPPYVRGHYCAEYMAVRCR